MSDEKDIKVVENNPIKTKEEMEWDILTDLQKKISYNYCKVIDDFAKKIVELKIKEPGFAFSRLARSDEDPSYPILANTIISYDNIPLVGITVSVTDPGEFKIVSKIYESDIQDELYKVAATGS